MAETHESELCEVLRARVGRFVRRRAHYRTPLLEFFSTLNQREWRSVIFGGTLRDLMIRGSSEQPRDVDVVVDVPTIELLADLFQSSIRKRTRFGGLHLNVGGWPIDVWPLESTWAFRTGKVASATFESLPSTTFLNVEAVAAELWPRPGRARRIYDREFFNAVTSRTVEINFADNPFSELCVVRSLLTAARLDYALGPRLAEYIRVHGSTLKDDDLNDIQIGHYGKIRCDGAEMKVWIQWLTSTRDDPEMRVRLPLSRPTQLSLWDDWDPAC
ncbi:MAG: hypothetical protein IH602_13620 [Bryobacteraceae bacterium]|nr:hypothetical protein [Bryobacteraceae bacterium]